MPVTLATVRQDVLNRLDDANGNFWSNVDGSELDTWINEGCRDIARRAEVLQSYNTTITTTATTGTYPLPTDTIRVHRVEYKPAGSNQTYTVHPSTYEEMDQLWGIYQSIQSSYPSYFVIRGWTAGTGNDALTLQLYPVPSATGDTLNIYYYRLPVLVTAGGTNLEIPEGWQDLVSLYAESIARRKSKDPSWQEARQMYEDELKNMIDVSRFYHDSSSSIITRTGAVPAWLYEFD